LSLIFNSILWLLLDKVDIESTCLSRMNLLGIENDIIQIGVCLLNVNTGEITNNTGVFVKPEGSVLSFFTVLTTITPKMI